MMLRETMRPHHLSDQEKARLFDAALNAAGAKIADDDSAPARHARSLAPLVMACAAAYIAIRDREEGIV
jgi:hypothetical protein